MFPVSGAPFSFKIINTHTRTHTYSLSSSPPSLSSSTPFYCKLSPSDTMFMGCSAAMEPNFQVDDLLDFPIEDEADDTESALNSPLIPHATASLLFAPPLSAPTIQLHKEEAALHVEPSGPSHGLCVPPDELVHQLEWLSSFNEDNFFVGGDAKLVPPTPSSSRVSSGVTRCKEAPITGRRGRDDFRSESPVSVLEHGGHAYALNHHVQRANRIRKARTGGRVWSLDILKPILFENRLKASYENTSLLVTSCSSAYSEPLCSFLQPDDSERPYKKIKQVSPNDAAMVDFALARKCTHCSVQKTPQWRAGPLGPKTLCNACGVRYKSGRLVPEYRPAASPSFVNEVHSNSHRRILEMRRVKEVEWSVKPHKSKVERAYKMDFKRESCLLPHTSEEHTRKETHKFKENSSHEEVSVCEDVEESSDGGISGEGSRGKEDSIDGGINSSEAHLHEAPNSTLACKEKHLQENVCVCNTEAVCEGRLPCEKDANADIFVQNNVTSLVKMEMDKWPGHKVEAGVQSDLEKKAVYVAKQQ